VAPPVRGVRAGPQHRRAGRLRPGAAAGRVLRLLAADPADLRPQPAGPVQR
jgi:hypothetical protein